MLGAVWLVTVLIAGICTWQLRSNRYRSYAEQSLKNVVVSGIVQIDALIENSAETDGELPVAQIAYQLYRVDATRQVLRNIYVEDNPGELSTSPSVWMRCGDVVCALQESAGDRSEESFFDDLNALCNDWSAVFEQGQDADNFEYELTQLEDSLQEIISPYLSLINGE